MSEHIMKVIMTSEETRYLFQFGQTNPGSVCQSFGGVGRNIAGRFLSDYVHAQVSISSSSSDCFTLTSLVLSFETL